MCSSRHHILHTVGKVIFVALILAAGYGACLGSGAIFQYIVTRIFDTPMKHDYCGVGSNGYELTLVCPMLGLLLLAAAGCALTIPVGFIYLCYRMCHQGGY